MTTVAKDSLAGRFPGLFLNNRIPSLNQVIAACVESWGMVGNTTATAMDIQAVIKQFSELTKPSPVHAPTPTTSGKPAAPARPPSALAQGKGIENI